MPLKIVYLDDEADLLEIFVDNFASANREINTFTNPQLALEFIHANYPDVVLLDFRMPSTTGDEVAQAIKINVMKVLITGDIETATITAFERKFAKPFPYDEIEKYLLSLTDKRAA
jgi:DNA-binding NtrC family response regulator